MLKRFVLFCLLLTCSAALFAQQSKSVTGTVTDSATGEPLIGVTVIEPGTTNGTVTDFDGNFTLTVQGNNLSFSYVGYTTQVATVNQSGNLLIRLVSSIELDEVVVVGYGVQRKSDLTGAISSISGKELQNQAAANVSNLLAGKAAGVFVSSSSGQPGSSAIVRIRGLGTVNDNNPLYVVDGQFMDDINSVNPADIERIEILKDASALAIYGSRGANGVIIVSTKKGVSGQTTVNLDISLGVKNAYKSFDMMNSDQYYNYIMDSRVTDSNWDNTAATGNAYKFTQLYKRGYNTNWWDEATQTGFTQNYNLSIRKGTDNSRTVMSLGYLGEEGTIITTNFNRVSLRLGQEYDLGDRITIGANLNAAQMRQRSADAVGTFSNILKAEPFTPVINPLVDPNSANDGL